MGCITGCIAKSILITGNIAILILAGAVAGLSAFAIWFFHEMGDLISSDANTVLKTLVTFSSFAAILAVIGFVALCCCLNKVFMIVYGVAGAILVVSILATSSTGLANSDSYQNETEANMVNAVSKYKINDRDDYENIMDVVYFTAQCCGAHGPEDFHFPGAPNQLPYGCCSTFVADAVGQPKECDKKDGLVAPWSSGCYPKFKDIIDNVIVIDFKLGIFFSLCIGGMVILTAACICFTDAMPI